MRTIRTDIQNRIRRAAHVLGDAATERVVAFFQSRILPDGGFAGRTGRSDLYYTMFGVESLAGLSPEFGGGRTVEYLSRFVEQVAQLDLVHIAVLARVSATLSERGDHLDGSDAQPILAGLREAVAGQAPQYRLADGGFGPAKGAGRSTAYGCFLGVGMYQDLGLELPDPAALVRFLDGLRNDDGGYRNEPDVQAGSVPATAAAIATLCYVARPPEPPGTRVIQGESKPEASAHPAGEDPSMREPSPRRGEEDPSLTLRVAMEGGASDGDRRAPECSAVGAIQPDSVQWLLGCAKPDGGFSVTPDISMPDLLSTATALHALRLAGAPDEAIARIREPCLDFVDSLWHGRGAFGACAADATCDCEYTYYGLLALGNLT